MNFNLERRAAELKARAMGEMAKPAARLLPEAVRLLVLENFAITEMLAHELAILRVRIAQQQQGAADGE